jgi:hypothetical protein
MRSKLAISWQLIGDFTVEFVPFPFAPSLWKPAVRLSNWANRPSKYRMIHQMIEERKGSAPQKGQWGHNGAIMGPNAPPPDLEKT